MVRNLNPAKKIYDETSRTNVSRLRHRNDTCSQEFKVVEAKDSRMNITKNKNMSRRQKHKMPQSSALSILNNVT